MASEFSFLTGPVQEGGRKRSSLNAAATELLTCAVRVQSAATEKDAKEARERLDAAVERAIRTYQRSPADEIRLLVTAKDDAERAQRVVHAVKQLAEKYPNLRDFAIKSARR